MKALRSVHVEAKEVQCGVQVRTRPDSSAHRIKGFSIGRWADSHDPAEMFPQGGGASKAHCTSDVLNG